MDPTWEPLEFVRPTPPLRRELRKRNRPTPQYEMAIFLENLTELPVPVEEEEEAEGQAVENAMSFCTVHSEEGSVNRFQDHQVVVDSMAPIEEGIVGSAVSHTVFTRYVRRRNTSRADNLMDPNATGEGNRDHTGSRLDSCSSVVSTGNIEISGKDDEIYSRSVDLTDNYQQQNRILLRHRRDIWKAKNRKRVRNGRALLPFKFSEAPRDVNVAKFASL